MTNTSSDRHADYVAVDEHGRTARDRLRTYLERLDAADAALWGGSIWTDDLWPYDEESGDLIGVTMVDDIRTLMHQCDLWVPLPAADHSDGKERSCEQ